MPFSHQLARRTLIKAGATVGTVVALTLATSTSALAKVGDLTDTRRKIVDRFTARKNRTYSGRRTANGWDAELQADAGGGVWTREVAGTPVVVALQDGAPRTLLEYVIRRFHLEIHELGHDDVIGFATNVPATGPTSNHASGTAVHVLPRMYPAGSSDGMFDHQVRVVRDILKQCNGQVAWGGDLTPRCQGLFYLTAAPTSTKLSATAGGRRQREARPDGKAARELLGA